MTVIVEEGTKEQQVYQVGKLKKAIKTYASEDERSFTGPESQAGISGERNGKRGMAIQMPMGKGWEEILSDHH